MVKRYTGKKVQSLIHFIYYNGQKGIKYDKTKDIKSKVYSVQNYCNKIENAIRIDEIFYNM